MFSWSTACGWITIAVSAESIHNGFGTKAALAKAVFDFVIAGDDEPLPVWRRSEADAIRAEPDSAAPESGSTALRKP